MSSRRCKATGFSLVELLVALSVGLLVALAAGGVYLTLRNGEHTLDNLSDLQQGARFITERLKRDVRMAGYFGNTYQNWNLRQSGDSAFQLPVASGECFQAGDPGAAFRWAVPLSLATNGETPPGVYGADSAAPFTGCIDATALSADSDVLSLHYLGPDSVDPTALAAPAYYVQSSLGGLFGFFCTGSRSGTACLPSDIPPAGIDTRYYPLVSRLYYVRRWARSDGDGIPTLMVTELSGSTVQTQPLVEGVAVFQVLYGIDDNDDGSIDRYLPAAAIGDLGVDHLARWNRVKTVSVWFVLRGTAPDPSRVSSTDRTYTLAGNSYRVDGRYMSRDYHTTIALRNPRDRAGGI